MIVWRCEVIRFGTKAETLKALQGRLGNAKVLPQVSFTVREWESGAPGDFWMQCLEMQEGGGKFIVRSSAVNEDTEEGSQAGRFESIGNVSGVREFEYAVNAVIASFDDDNEENQVLVQPMLEDVKMCGVAFTVDPNSLGNYYVINYDESGSTSAVVYIFQI